MEAEFIFKLTEQEANLIGQALGEMPAKISMNLISKLQLQFQEQVKKEDLADKLERR